MINIYKSRVYCRVRVTRRVELPARAAGMGAFSYPSAGMGNPMGKNSIWRVRVWVPTTHRVRTRCHLDF